VLFGEYDPQTLPTQLIQPENGALTLLLDQAAAAKLPKPGPDGAGKVELAR
jgi:6-phosphogluconolactonase